MFGDLKDSIKDFSEKAKSAVVEKELSEDDIDDLLWDLEMQLLQNNVAQMVVDELIEELRDDLVGKTVKRTEVETVVRDSLHDAIVDVLKDPGEPIEEELASGTPTEALFMGFNGSGKTTTIAKIAAAFKDEYEIVLAAGDTFRSAAIDQLEEHGDNLGLKVISHDYGSDAAAVIYDAKEHAEKEGKDLILADTAGRSHEDTNLMDELDKICRVNEPDLKFLVVDALAGNDVVNQAEQYEEIGFDAIVLTKVDVDKKGGAALSLGHVTGRPIVYLGTGQDYDDLERFNPEQLADDLVDSSG